MKAVGDLAGLRSALPDPLGVKSAAVAAHDLDLWPPREPIRGLLAERVSRTSATVRRSRSTTIVP